jgi:hypothetical protein
MDMKILVILMMLATLYWFYRIAFPKSKEMKKGDEIPPQRPIEISEVVVKSRFVRPGLGQPKTSAATSLGTDPQAEKPDIFATGNEKKEAVIPPEKLDEIFSEEVNPEDLDIERDENEADADRVVDGEEEAEELRQALGDAGQAYGLSIEEMTAAVRATENPTDEKAALLYRIERTDMFEQLVSGDEGKAERIAAIIERHIQRVVPQDTNEDNNNSDPEDFDVMKLLS